MKIVVLDGFTLNPGDLSWKGLEQIGNVKVYDRLPSVHSEIVKAIDDATYVFTNKTPLPKEVLEKTPHLQYIGVLATGFNVVDVNYAQEKGITVTNVPTMVPRESPR